MLSKTKIVVVALAVATAGLLATRAANSVTVSGTWTNLTAFPGTGGNGPATALLLTDGSVVMIDICTPNWYRLIPDQFGHYTSGSWSAFAVGDNKPIAPMIGSGTTPDGYGPEFFASAVLPDGRLIVQGGEAENSANNPPTVSACPGTGSPADSTKGSLYNPFTNTWSAVPPPAGWTQIGDSPSALLGTNSINFVAGSYMVGNGPQGGVQGSQYAVATIAPIPGTAVTWTIGSVGKADPNSEEGWTLLPNGQLLTVDVQNGTAAELFNPALNSWGSAGNTPVFLGQAPPPTPPCPCVAEMGPAVGIGFNMVVQIGASPNTAVYTFPNGWTAGPAAAGAPPGQSFPGGQGTVDGPASLLPNGNILAQTSVAFTAPSNFWEFGVDNVTPQTPGAGTLTQVNAPTCAAGVAAYQGRMLLIPSGQILWDAGLGGGGNTCVSIYVPNAGDGTFNNVMRPPPHIISISNTTLFRGNTYSLTGSMFNGFSQGAMYGDDGQMATNYPMVRITNNTTNHVCWGRTHNWSILTSAQFDVPPATTPAANWPLVENPCDPGASTLVVVTNGLVSNPIAVTMN
jgi:hypothetical protein